MGRAGRLIFFKKLTSNLLPFCTMVVVAIVSSAVLQNLLEDTEMVRYIAFGFAALIMIVGSIFVFLERTFQTDKWLSTSALSDSLLYNPVKSVSQVVYANVFPDKETEEVKSEE